MNFFGIITRLIILALMLGKSSFAVGIELPSFDLSNGQPEEFDVSQAEKSVLQIYALSRVRGEKGRMVLTGGSGSGFVVTNEGHIVTNWHVVTRSVKYTDGSSSAVNNDKIYVFRKGERIPNISELYENKDGNYHSAEILYAGERRDIAVLKASPLIAPSMTISSVQPEKGSSVSVLGYPGIADQVFGASIIEPTLTKGVVGRVYSTNRGNDLLQLVQHSAQINSGNSGGPLLNRCGQVVGINTWGPREYIKTDGSLQTSAGVFYSSSSKEILSVLDQKDISVDITLEKCRAGGTQNNNLLIGVVGGVIILLLFILLLKSSRRAVVQAVSRTSDVLSRKVSHRAAPPAKHIQGTSRISKSLQLQGKGTFSEYFMGVEAEEMKTLPAGIIIGKDKGKATLVIGDDRVSRSHARVSMKNGSFTIEDLNSTNGSSLNSKKLIENQAQVLRTGDRLKVGPVEFNIIVE